MGKKISSLFAINFLLQFLLVNILLAQPTGKIAGTVVDASTREALPGANVILEGLFIGAATDANGEFVIYNVPAGEQTITVVYVGYKQKSKKTIIPENKTKTVNIELKFVAIETDEIVITAQAEGQIAAINQQLNARSIKNVVSAKQIQDIPDANAAEAVSRLPGVSLLREGGEGQKVVIRGIAPKYNKIEISGVQIASTDNSDRSTNISMISPYMLDGIEVTKAAMPDKEADVIGGTVNFILKETPQEFRFDVLSQGAFNGLDNSFGDYKIMGSASNRFLDNKLGLFAQIDFEQRNRNSFELNVNYDNKIKLENRTAAFDSIGGYTPAMALSDIGRDVNRFGGAIIFDYKLPGGSIKYYTFLSKIEKESIARNDIFNPSSNTRFLGLSQNENNLTIAINSFRIEQEINNFVFDGGGSYSYSKNDQPNEISIRGIDKQAFGDSSKIAEKKNPVIIPGFAQNDLSTLELYDISLSSAKNETSEFSADLNIEYNIRLPLDINLKLKSGGKLKTRFKEFNAESERTPFTWDPRWNDFVVSQFFDDSYLGLNNLPYSIFLDSDINSKKFPGIDHRFNSMPDNELVKSMAQFLHNTDTSYYDYVKSKKNDYKGNEYYRAGYLMSEVKIGESITLTPGIRYEYNETKYKGIRGDESAQLSYQGYEHFDTTTSRINDFWLPMVHFRYKPLDWFDLRLAYTQTIARPNFNQIIPSWNITDLHVSWNNPELKPALSENYDGYASFYENYIGLFTIGWFKKDISDFIFYAEPTGNLDSSATDLPDFARDKPITRWINNKFPVKLWGIETEWQTHFWYLPGVLKGLVLKVNYTHTFSEARYPRTTQKTIGVPPFQTTEFTDTTYTDRLLLQPSDIVNVTLGYDYQGFSIRLSYVYSDDIFSQTHFYTSLQGTSEAFEKWDIAVRQKLPVDGLELFANVNNISNSLERDIVRGKVDFPRREQHYGLTADFGLRFRL